MQQITFSYPRRGLDGHFNTFRLGVKWSSLIRGSVVDLVDARTKRLIKQASVLGVFTGTLESLAPVHAKWAHNWREHPEDQRAELLIASMKRRYPPGRVRDDSPCSVIYLREIIHANLIE
jgi:hypothetical protein